MPPVTASRLKPLKQEASRIYKLCLEKDGKGLLQGLGLAAALGKPLEGLLDEVSIDPSSGELIKGKRFTGSDKSQPLLDTLLIQQLGLAQKGTPAYQTRMAIKKLTCIAAVVPSLESFGGLEELVLKFPTKFEGQDLQALGLLAKLKILKLDKYIAFGQAMPTLKSLEGLQAPKLEDLSAPFMGLKNVDALANCTNLITVDLKGNSDIKNIDALTSSNNSLQNLCLDYCKGVSSLKALQNAKKLVRLEVSGTQISKLDDLKNLKHLEVIDFSGCEKLESLSGLPIKSLANSNDEPGEDPYPSIHLNNLLSLPTLDGFPPLSSHVTELAFNKALKLKNIDGLKASKESLKELKIHGAQITDLNALAGLTLLEKLEISVCPNLVDASALGALEHLHSVSIQVCNKLEILPSEWKSPVKALSLGSCPALKRINSLPPGIDPKAIVVDDRRLLPRTKAAKPLKSDVGSVWKLLSSRNIADILMGIELSCGVDEGLEILYADVTVKDGELVRGKRFSGTGPAQPYLDFALFGLMQRADPNSAFAKLREKIKVLNLTLAEQSPHLEGLKNLESLSITPLDEKTPDLSNFGPMPSLTTLNITGRRWNAVGGLSSLNGLDAPNLYKVDLSSIYIQDLSALNNSPKITSLDLQGNNSLENLDGLSACAPNLTELNLTRCTNLSNIDVLSSAVSLKSLDLNGCEAITSIKALAACKLLKTIDLENCKGLVSLEGLENIPLECKSDYQNSIIFSLDGCSSLKSLSFFPPIGDAINCLSLEYTNNLKDFQGLRTLNNVSSLTASNSGLSNLQDIGAMPNLTAIYLNGCSELHDAKPLGTLEKLETLDLSDSSVQDMPHSWSPPLTSISLKNCGLLKSLGYLPKTLKSLICDGSNSLTKLDGIKDCNELELISILKCKSLVELGDLPKNVKKVIANSCSQLKSLEGLQHCDSIEFVGVPLSITNASALIHIPNLTIDINVLEVIPEKDDGKQPATLPKALLKTLNLLPSINLQATGPSGSWYAKSTFDLASFNQFKNLRTLSFVEFNISSKMEGLTWLVPIENLEGLWFYPRGSLSYTLGSSIYDSARKIKALQLKICQEAKITPPAHLLGA
ncbi:hypothetical protein [Polynucleobacter sp. JS-Polo-80-F4]|uniref:hypothetical protein n=1 Tax=Polynucleobacter sp. JS-Polo-80-F4 TaxID=2576918 RepID=UPI001C0D1B94|nr:hypothetical protein [Polynucleobacter sp. JS-Polo-80-F4]MBU3617260.1 hypothetical protein [Polynucleobacter sp. JS-Polo-80-F4]